MHEPLRPRESRFQLLDSVRREIAREERAARQMRRVEQGQIPLDELGGSLSPAPARQRSSRPRRPVEPTVDASESSAAFILVCAMALFAGMSLAFGAVSLVASISTLLAS